ncbi:hypothetical protein C805_03210 [Eubacterium sp. 14-2]|uniref:TaqI-like C-terminal specificity domain-containing protein n=1 Tax=Eubacterium sp. 14-2 TaxID=1235790 RepID=UPI00033B4303|nr:TaqI-like C-terminal specificity domain-containing protein [Eubacterium sp. 14-2]EOT23545.1 hypothetical protein C805_03210 [Eubacterium sp. 14-2]
MKPSEKKEYSLPELCSLLSISPATGRNWIKLGKLLPSARRNGKPCFSAAYAEELLTQLKEKPGSALKSRRNKKYITGNSTYRNYLPPGSPNLGQIENLLVQLSGLSLTDRQIRAVLAECALQLLYPAEKRKTELTGHLLSHFLRGSLPLKEYGVLVHDLLTGKEQQDCQCLSEFLKEDILKNLSVTLLPEKNADILGMIYISLKNLGERKAAGSYYTPAHIVKKLTDSLLPEQFREQPFNVLDPCCGTGNFLLQLPDSLPLEQIFGQDTDADSIFLARINMALKFQHEPVSRIKKQIRLRDFLLEQDSRQYRLILGNPPWGFQFDKTAENYIKKNFQTAGKNHTESCDVFLEQALTRTAPNGTVAFIIPEAVLHVKSHLPVRRLIAARTRIERLEYLENAFHGVQCPAVILQLTNTGRPLDTKNMKISGQNREFEILLSRSVNPENFNFHITDKAYQLIEKTEKQHNMTFLKGQAEFALGIVTGNNSALLQHRKTDHNEVVLKGTDIHRYRITPQNLYLTYQPETFQQCAPESCYRADEKLLYRFIGSQLVFAYDNRKRLSLNSCNILIPRIPHLDIRYVLALLNSRTAQFIYENKFHSLKVLRASLEQIPIPPIPQQEQQCIISLTEKLSEETDSRKWLEYYNKADLLIAAAYGLTEEEYRMIIFSSQEIFR